MDIKNLKQKIEVKLNELNHLYIKNIVGHPRVDEDKLMFLASIIGSQSSLSTFEKERFIITTMLIEIALDNHEQVPVSFDKEMSHDVKAINQLRVLAGDYYSGHYYLLLSELEEVELISYLASAIKEINENKMKLYYKEIGSLEESILIANKIDVILISLVGSYFKNEILNELAREWFLVKRLSQERDNLLNDVESVLLSKCKTENLTLEINNFIQRRVPSVQLLLEKLPNEYNDLKTFITHRLQTTLNEKNTSIVEEG